MTRRCLVRATSQWVWGPAWITHCSRCRDRRYGGVGANASHGLAARWFTKLDLARCEIDHLWPGALPNGKGALLSAAVQGRKPGIEDLSFAFAVAELP